MQPCEVIGVVHHVPLSLLSGEGILLHIILNGSKVSFIAPGREPTTSVHQVVLEFRLPLVEEGLESH